MDQVGVRDNVLVGRIDLLPLAGIAVFALGDLGKTVARTDELEACTSEKSATRFSGTFLSLSSSLPVSLSSSPMVVLRVGYATCLGRMRASVHSNHRDDFINRGEFDGEIAHRVWPR
jgi:hypothetical protein